jgi:hypothetical protein
MKSIHRVSALSLSLTIGFAPLTASAAGLSAAVAPCPTEVRQGLETIAIGIAAASVSNLVGAAVDRAVTYLKSDRSRAYSASVPLVDLGDIFDQTDLALPSSAPRRAPRSHACLYLSSDSLAAIGKSSPPGSVLEGLRKGADFFAILRFLRSPSSSTVFKPVIQEWNYNRFLDRGCPLFRSCKKRDVVVRLLFKSPTNPDGTAVPNAQAMSVVLAGVSPADVNGVFRPGLELPWFRTDLTSGPVNLAFELVETSKPGAFAKALADALSAQKEPLQTQANAWVTSTLQNTPNSQVEAETAARLKAAQADYSAYMNAYSAALAALDSINAATDDNARREAISKYRVLREESLQAERRAEASYRMARLRMERLQPLPPI